MKSCYSDFWIFILSKIEGLYSMARLSLHVADVSATAAEFFFRLLRFKSDAEIGPFGNFEIASKKEFS